jgi:hypothetical protein
MSGVVNISKYYFNEIGQRFKHSNVQVDQLVKKVRTTRTNLFLFFRKYIY